MKITNHQLEVTNGVISDIRRGQSTCLIGRAGVGKTYTLSYILPKIYMPIICASPTHSAAGVFSEATDRNCCTIASLLKKKKEINFKTGEVLFDPNVTVNHKQFCIVIDEASMLGGSDYRTLRKNFPNCVFLFVGDSGQLPPVVTTEEQARETVETGKPWEPFCVFDLEELTKHVLEINMRCGQNNAMFDLIESVYNTPDILPDFFSSLKTNGNIEIILSEDVTKDSIVITYRNNRRKDLNSQILDKFEKIVSTSTKFIANENIGYDKKSSTYLLKNGETFYPEKVIYKEYRIPTTNITFSYHEIKVNDGHVFYVPNREKLDSHLSHLKEIQDWKSYFAFMDLFPNVDLGYAITSHKSQGQTFTDVTVDVNDIMSINDPLVKKSSLYVALSRSSDRLRLIL
jgi:ATP-dependent exoDNAse (exonuclease V) alpha subunit